MVKANQALVSDSWATLFPISLIHCDRMGLAGPVKQQMFCSNVTPAMPKKLPVAVRVFGADLAQVLANGEQQGMM